MGAIFTTKSTKTIDISVKVNGKSHRVSFMPSVLFGMKGESLYSTADEDITKALKNHKYYGVYFFLKSEDAPAPVLINEETKTIEDELTDPENAIIVESVTTKGMAIAYIQGMYGESFTTTTVEDMKREAAQKWNTLFPKWGK
jgi:hypothetical protein